MDAWFLGLCRAPCKLYPWSWSLFISVKGNFPCLFVCHLMVGRFKPSISWASLLLYRLYAQNLNFYMHGSCQIMVIEYGQPWWASGSNGPCITKVPPPCSEDVPHFIFRFYIWFVTCRFQDLKAGSKVALLKGSEPVAITGSTIDGPTRSMWYPNSNVECGCFHISGFEH